VFRKKDGGISGSSKKSVPKSERFFDNRFTKGAPHCFLIYLIPFVKYFIPLVLEVVSKSQIRFKGKAQADRESAAYMGM
jgi:hypothetical protein